MKSILLSLFLSGLVLSCNNSPNQPPANPPTSLKPSIGIMISEDTAKLSKLLDLNKFRPLGATFQTGGNAPTGLEAVLYYDESTYGDILNAYMEAGFPKGNYAKEQFDFSWLDSAQHNELQFSKPDYTGNPDIFLGTKGKGKLWFLDKKVLVKVDN